VSAAPYGGRASYGPFDTPLAAILHAAREAVVTVDEQQRIVMINPAAQRMFGCSAGEVLGQPMSRFIPQHLRAAHAEHVRHFDSSGATELRMDERRTVTALRANGEEFPAEASISRVDVPGPAGPRHYFTALLRDLSIEHGLRDEVATVKQRFRTIFEMAPAAAWITEDDRIVFANHACASLFGTADHESLQGKSIYDFLPHEAHEPIQERMLQALAGNAGVPRVHGRIARQDGSVREVEIAVAALPDHGHTTVQMVLIDITQRRQEALELERSRLELRQLSASLVEAREEERRRIARELHDELGQRLSALKMELASLHQAPRSAKRDARAAAMTEMLDQTMASVRRIAADLRPMMLDDLGLNAAIEWLARESARRMGIAITAHLPENDPALDSRASTAVYRMVQEALTNVARHARATEVQIDLHATAGELVLTVRDNGIGFPVLATQPEGSFGLMGIRERAFMLGGTLQLDNPPGGGGRVTVRLPLLPAANAPAPSAPRVTT